MKITITKFTKKYPIPARVGKKKEKNLSIYKMESMEIGESFDVIRLSPGDRDFCYRVTSDLRQLSLRLGRDISIRTVDHFPSEKTRPTSYDARVLRIWRIS